MQDGKVDVSVKVLWKQVKVYRTQINSKLIHIFPRKKNGVYEIGAIAQGKPAKHSIFLEPQNPAIHEHISWHSETYIDEFGGFEIMKCSAGLFFLETVVDTSESLLI